MKELKLFSELGEELSLLMTAQFSNENIKSKQQTIEKICADIAEYFRANGLSDVRSDFLEPHAYQIQNKIKDINIRSLHIMEG